MYQSVLHHRTRHAALPRAVGAGLSKSLFKLCRWTPQPALAFHLQRRGQPPFVATYQSVGHYRS